MDKGLVILHDILDRVEMRKRAVVVKALFKQELPNQDDRVLLLSILKQQEYDIVEDQYALTISRKAVIQNETKEAVSEGV